MLRHDTITLLEENTGRTAYDINRSNTFLGQSPKAIETKAKTNKWNPVKLTSSCTAKETTNKMKRQPLEWEKTLTNDATNKGSISKTHKQVIQPNNKKTTQSENGQKTQTDPSPKKTANRHVKRCSTLPTIKRNANQSHPRWPEWTSSKSPQVTNSGECAEEKGTHTHTPPLTHTLSLSLSLSLCWWECKRVQPPCKTA